MIKELTYKEKRSEFISLLFDCKSITDANKIIAEIKKKHYKAKHVLACLNLKSTNLAKEDGEPIKSMHLLLEYMNRNAIFEKLVVIVRYYGGVNLGQNRLSKVYYNQGVEILENQ